MFLPQNTYINSYILSKLMWQFCVSCELCFSVRETKTQLPLSALRKVWGEAVSYICGLKEDYIRLYRGQRAAMLVHKHTHIYIYTNTQKRPYPVFVSV